MIKITQNELNEFYATVFKTMDKSPQLRKGQAYFNVAYKMWPEETNRIRGTNDDCFYDDSKIENFMNHFDVVNTDIKQRCCRTYDVAKGGNSTDDCCVELNSRLDHGWRVVCVTSKTDYIEYIIEKEVDDNRRG